VSKTEATESETLPKKRGAGVPLEDAPLPGLSPRAREVIALALCGFALYGLLCLSTFHVKELDGTIPASGMRNLGGAVGYHLAHGFTRALGLAGAIPFLLLLVGAMLLFLGRGIHRLTIKVLGAVVFSAMMAILFASPDGLAGVRDATPYGAGGVFGSFVSPKLQSAFGGTGRLLVVGFGALVSLLMATEWMFSQLLLRTLAAADSCWRRLWRVPAPATTGPDVIDLITGAGDPPPRRRRASTAEEEGDEGEEATDEDEEEGADSGGRRRASRRAAAKAEADGAEPGLDKHGAEQEGEPFAIEPALKPVVIRPKPRPKPKKKATVQNTLPFDDYPFPPVELFQEAVSADLGVTSVNLTRGGQAIVQKLANFGIQSEVVAASVGPAVTQYELRLAESIRVNKVVGFESDLAATLKAVSVRVVAPIPGKDTIGVEVPNFERQKVFMRDLLDQFGRSEQLAIPLYLGKDVAGNPIVEDLTRMPHLLIAGTTGSGKSVCINTILLSILMTRTPNQVKLILVDPKMVELQSYKSVPHLCCDVVTNMKKAPGVLQWAVDEMENRYALLSGAGVNHIRNYNRLGQQELSKRLQREPDGDRVHLPYLVIVIDEFADLMNVAQNEVEELIQRLAQKARSVGIHVILATQRPSSEVITGVIKANLPCQISFKVNRRIDSRVILDVNGAEKLLGFGDMLYMPPSGGSLVRAQGTFVADDEMLAVVRYLEEHGMQPQFNPALVQTQTSSRPSIADSDERYHEAVEVVLGQQRGSATLLQRALAVGYTRATRLLELMEEDGLVGPFVGSKSREVLLTLDEWKAREEQMAEAMEQLGEAEAEGGAVPKHDGTEAPSPASPAETSSSRDGEADAAAAAADSR